MDGLKLVLESARLMLAERQVDCSLILDKLRKRIDELKQELELLKQVYTIIELHCKSGGEAGIHRARNILKLVLPKPVPKSNPYIKYLIRVLKQLQEDYGDKLDYTLEETDEGVKSIVVIGVDKDTYDEVYAALDYVALKLGIKRSKEQYQDQEQPGSS